jgi:hypothetical protein
MNLLGLQLIGLAIPFIKELPRANWNCAGTALVRRKKKRRPEISGRRTSISRAVSRRFICYPNLSIPVCVLYTRFHSPFGSGIKYNQNIIFVKYFFAAEAAHRRNTVPQGRHFASPIGEGAD